MVYAGVMHRALRPAEYNRFTRWSRMDGCLRQDFRGTAVNNGGRPDQLMIDATPSQGTPHSGQPVGKVLFHDVSAAPMAA